VVDVLDAAQAPADDETPAPGVRARLTRFRPHDWKDYAPWLLVAFAVAFTAWLLRAELRAIPYPNDATTHAGMARFAEQRIRAGHSPFDAWFPYLGLGSPQFSEYQSLSHIFTGLLSIAFGDSTFRWANYLMLSTWPISVYVGARLLGLDKWQAATAALFSPMLVNVKGYGFEWGSFIWLGSGMWSMLWALWLLPIALGLGYRAIAHKERIALAAFVVGLTCALHFITGYLVLLSLGVFVIVRPSEFLKRLGRAAIVGVGGILIFAFVFIPTIGDLDYVNVDSFQANTFWVNSFGAGKVFSWLFHGEVFDFGRAPIVSLLVVVGVVVCLLRSIRSEVARVPLGIMLLSLAMYSGRGVVGPVINHLPGGTNILLHRYIIGVHLAGMLLAGIGAVWAAGIVIRAGRRLLQFRFGEVVAVAMVAVLAFVVLLPVLRNRERYAHDNTYFTGTQVAADNDYGRDAFALINIAKARGDGRVYAGASNNWGAGTRIGQVPLYQLPAQQDADSIGFYLRTNSLSADVEAYFDETNPAQYDLFNVKYVLLPNPRQPAVPATLIAQQGAYSLYQVNTSGYLEVVDTTEPVAANNEDMALVMAPYLSSAAVGQLRHPLVAFDGRSTPEPSTSAAAPYAGPPGSMQFNYADYDNGRFSGRVHADRNAWVMLKESYSPRWTATVDGVPVKTAMLAPSFVGVPVSAGDHYVAFRYKPISHYPLYFAIGALTLLGLIFGPVLWRRNRRRTAPSDDGADAPNDERDTSDVASDPAGAVS